MFDTTYECLLTWISVVTVFLQLYVFYLVKYKSPRKMGDYRFFLYMFTIFDLIFTFLLGLCLQPSPVLPFAAGTVQGLSKYLGFEASMITTALIFYAGTIVIGYQDMSLMYRYSMLHSNKLIKNILMSNYSKFIGGFFMHGFAGMLAFFMYHTLATEKEVPNFYYHLSNPIFKNNFTEDDIIIIMDVSKPITLWFMRTVVLLFILSEAVSITLVFLILSILRRNSDSFSHNAYKVHRQFTILLGVQLSIPIVFVFFPVAACVFFIQTRRLISKESINIGFVLLSSYGLFNALFTVLFVSNYRWQAYEHLVRPWLEPLCKIMSIDQKLPKQEPQPEAPPTTTDQVLPRNKIDVCGAGLQMVEVGSPIPNKNQRF